MTGPLPTEQERGSHIIQVIARAFAVLSCFDNPAVPLGNREISDRCGLPRATVSRLTLTLTCIGQLTYLPEKQKYRLGAAALAFRELASSAADHSFETDHIERFNVNLT